MLRIEIVVKKQAKVRHKIKGVINIAPENLTMLACQKILETERFLEDLTGLRFHINIVEKEKL